jgi:hypothetical protein
VGDRVQNPEKEDDRRTEEGEFYPRKSERHSDKTLKDRILREASEITAEDVAEEAGYIGTLVAQSLGREPETGGFEFRLAEYCLRSGTLEILGEVCGRSEGKEVRHPSGYLAACLAQAVKDEEGRSEERACLPGTPAERFESARRLSIIPYR